MAINVNFTVINACFLTWSIASLLGENLKCVKENVNYVSYVCKQPPGSSGNFTLPGDLPKDIESLSIIVAEPNSMWVVTQLREFNSYPSLNTIHINTSKSWFLPGPHSLQNWKSKLFEVPSLQILRVVYKNGYNNVQHLWTLPEKLKHLYLENSVMDFDLRSTDNLFSLSLINTALTRIPDNNGLHYLAILDLRNNTLNEISSIQLASFCSLQEINLRDAKIEECECRRIDKLLEEMKKHSKLRTHFNCTPSTDTSCPSNWFEVRSIRELCLRDTASSVFHKIAVVVAVVALMIIVFIFGSVWILRHGTKRSA